MIIVIIARAALEEKWKPSPTFRKFVVFSSLSFSLALALPLLVLLTVSMLRSDI